MKEISLCLLPGYVHNTIKLGRGNKCICQFWRWNWWLWVKTC